jgi:hypothetical protein
MITEEETNKDVIKQVITLNFDCYEFFKFIETLEKYVDELEFVFENRELTICFMDASRIMLSKCRKYLNRLVYGSETLNRMVFGVNTKDLVNLLRCRKTDLKEIELTFDNTKDFIQLIKTSNKYNSVITRTYNTIEFNQQEIPMENLEKIDYTSKARFNTKFLNDFFYESSIFSEIVLIDINENVGISFSEEGCIGTSNYLIDANNCSEIIGFEKGSYAYSFLTPIKPLLPILTNSDITLHIKTDHPIKLELRMDSLDFDMIVYLAPRVEEASYNTYDNYDDDDEF